MQVTVERLPGSLVVLTISVDSDMVTKQAEVAYRKNASHVSVPGFRPGKAPRAMIEERLNPEVLLREAVDDLIETTFQQALKDNTLIPIEQAKLSDLKLEDDKSFSYVVSFTVEPEVTLGEYKGIEISATATEVTDEVVQAEIEKILDQSAKYEELTESGIIKGDYVVVDYTMKLNGEEYPDGITEGYPLEVGTDTFFTELNEGLLGIKVGEVVTVKTQYAADYSDADLAGKEGEFAITIKSLRRRVCPELNDEWVEKLSNGTLHTVEEFKDRVREHLEKQAEESDRDRIRTELVNKIVATAEVDIPEIMINEEAEELMQELEHRLSHNHVSLEDYAEYQKTTVDAIREEQRSIGKDVVRRTLILSKIAMNEKIFATEQDIDVAIMMQLLQQGAASDEKSLRKDTMKMRKELNKDGRVHEIAGRIRQQKILGFLEKNALITIDGVLFNQATADAEEVDATVTDDTIAEETSVAEEAAAE